jgi:hypothetical protein
MGPAVVTVCSLALLAIVVYAAAQRVERFDYPVALHAVCAVLSISTGVFASGLWNAPLWTALVVKAALWMALMALTWRVFILGREQRLLQMITIDFAGNADAEPTWRLAVRDGGSS